MPPALSTVFLRFLHNRKPCRHPALLAFWIVSHVRVTQRRQFTGSVSAGVSMIV